MGSERDWVEMEVWCYQHLVEPPRELLVMGFGKGYSQTLETADSRAQLQSLQRVGQRAGWETPRLGL